MLRVLLYKLSHQILQRFLLVNHVVETRLDTLLVGYRVDLHIIERLTDRGKVLHQHLEVLGSIGHRLTWRTTLDGVFHGGAALDLLVCGEASGFLVAAGVPRKVLLEHEGRLAWVLTALINF